MKPYLKLIIAVCLLLPATGAFAQTPGRLMTWVHTSGNSINLTNTLATNQVMEILSTAMDTSSQIDVVVKEETLSFGQGGGLLAPPIPFVVAGPATVVFRRTSSGGVGGLITYRISAQNMATPLTATR